MEELFKIVRLVRSLREPDMPEKNLGEEIGEKIRGSLYNGKNSIKNRNRWWISLTAVAAAVILIVTLNFYLSSNRRNMVYAMEKEIGVLGGGVYSGITDIVSVRWQEDGFEYAVVGNTTIDELSMFIRGLTNGDVELLPANGQSLDKPKVEVTVDLKIEEADQKSVDAGHSPWKLDPAFVAQVFVSLKISPEGIEGEYPIKYEDLNMLQNTGKEVIIEVIGEKNPIRKVYLKRLIRQDSTGIWTVVGYDPVEDNE